VHKNNGKIVAKLHVMKELKLNFIRERIERETKRNSLLKRTEVQCERFRQLFQRIFFIKQKILHIENLFKNK
jgi:hypothetical protein